MTNNREENMSANAQRQHTTSSATQWAQQHIAGSFADADEAAKRLQLAAERCHLIGGASVAPLKVGHEIVLAVVPINKANCYPTNAAAKAKAKGKTPDPNDDPPIWGIGKADLMALAAAAGVEWTACNRLDDGSSPFFAHYEVHGRYRQIDGSWRPISDQRDVDLRDGSSQTASLSPNQIAQYRETLIRSCITKARLRALRGGFGVAHGMTEEELAKPFVFARMVFTGQSNDPEIRRLFAGVIAQQQLAATAALYGGGIVPQFGAGAPAPVALVAPQPEPSIPSADFVDDYQDDFPSDPGEPAPPTPRSPAPAPPPPPPPAPEASARPQQGQQQRHAARPPRGGWVIPAGKTKGTPIAYANDKDLEYWGNRISRDLESGDVPAKFEARNRGLLKAIRDEQAKRSAPDDDVPEGYEVDPNTGEIIPTDEGMY